MIKKILTVGVFLIALILPTSIVGSQVAVSQYSKVAVHPHQSGWDKIQVNEYDVAVVWATDNPESYYILDARADLCFFVVATTNGISTTRVPCKPFLGKIDTLEDKFDICE